MNLRSMSKSSYDIFAKWIISQLDFHKRLQIVNLASNWFEESAYVRLANTGFKPTTIIDIGAFEGEWTRMVRQHFPEARSIMIEPQREKAEILARVCKEVPNTQMFEALLGSQSQQDATFYVMSTGSSMLPEISDIDRVAEQRKLSTLDELVLSSISQDNMVLKIDVQGAELEVLKGAEKVLSMSALVQLELAIGSYNVGAPSMLEVIAHMDSKGFVPYDLCGVARPSNKELAQIDLMFVPKSSSLRPESFKYK